MSLVQHDTGSSGYEHSGNCGYNDCKCPKQSCCENSPLKTTSQGQCSQVSDSNCQYIRKCAATDVIESNTDCFFDVLLDMHTASSVCEPERMCISSLHDQVHLIHRVPAKYSGYLNTAVSSSCAEVQAGQQGSQFCWHSGWGLQGPGRTCPPTSGLGCSRSRSQCEAVPQACSSITELNKTKAGCLHWGRLQCGLLCRHAAP